MSGLKEITQGVAALPISIANVYFVGEPGERWTLVDAGVPDRADDILEAAKERYGKNARPEAIVLTHGHFDHAGSARSLAEAWDVPIYVHPLEMPFITGRSKYPPADPTVGGFLAMLSRFFPHKPLNLGEHVRELPMDGAIPGMNGWRMIHTPGHTPGHVAYFRERDRVLLAGDALATVDLDSAFAVITKKKEFNKPPAPMTIDWTTARRSVNQLADLRPAIVGCGHGNPITEGNVAAQFARFAATFSTPSKGRYVRQPAIIDERGIVRLPPPVPDPLPKIAVTVGVAAVVGATIAYAMKRGKR
jgi:glyoxylase-like metal-dependent hydrolase (beta-lactamase superfamily II)